MKNEITLSELATYLNSLFDPHTFDEKVYNGVQVETKKPIHTIITAVSISKEIIEKAINRNAQAIIVHHGIFCKRDAHPLVGRLYDYLQLLITHNIALLCYHLPMDAQQEIGNNWGAARLLNLKECRPFLEIFGTPMGVIGKINMPLETFVNKASNLYRRKPDLVKVHDNVNTVAIVSGGADKYIKEASEAGADTFITGRVDEKVWDDAHEYNVSFLGFGHYATETIGPQLLAEKIEYELNISTEFIRTNNPF